MAQGAPLAIYSTISAKEALLELVPEFEHASGYPVNITCAGGPGLSRQIAEGLTGDFFIGTEEFSTPLIAQGKLAAASRTPFARSTTGLAVRAGLAKPDISTPEKLKQVLLVARGEADIAVQQISELLPVAGIQILDPLPAELQQIIVYGATAFANCTRHDVAQAFVRFLKADASRAVSRAKDLDPA